MTPGRTASIQHPQITLFTSFNRGMRLEAIAALLGHQKMEMTLIYAKIANRVAADEYAAVSAKIDALYGQPPALAGRLRDHRHGPAAPRSPRPDARQRAVHPPRRAGLPDGIGLRDLRLLPHRHPVSARPGPPARPRPPGSGQIYQFWASCAPGQAIVRHFVLSGGPSSSRLSEERSGCRSPIDVGGSPASVNVDRMRSNSVLMQLLDVLANVHCGGRRWICPKSRPACSSRNQQSKPT
jgi:hypothetical protein